MGMLLPAAIVVWRELECLVLFAHQTSQQDDLTDGSQDWVPDLLWDFHKK